MALQSHVKLMSLPAFRFPVTREVFRRPSGSFMRELGLYLIGWDIGTWSYLSAKETGKWGPLVGSSVPSLKIRVLLLRMETTKKKQTFPGPL